MANLSPSWFRGTPSFPNPSRPGYAAERYRARSLFRGGTLAPMKNPIFAALLMLCAASLAGQTPASSTVKTHTDPLGFSYSLPADWNLIDVQPSLPAIRQQVGSEVTSTEEKKGAECAQVPFLARRGDPPSVVEIVTMSFDCFGQKMTQNDLPGVGMGMAEGVKKSFNIVDPVYGAYTLGSHPIWIERASGNFLNSPDRKVEFEAVCAVLKSGVACWMAFLADDASLKAFEQGQVVLEDDTPVALVPPDALTKKPQ